MTLTFHCEHCGRKLAVPDSARGHSGRCPACGRQVEVPDAWTADGLALRDDPPPKFDLPVSTAAVFPGATGGPLRRPRWRPPRGSKNAVRPLTPEEMEAADPIAAILPLSAVERASRTRAFRREALRAVGWPLRNAGHFATLFGLLTAAVWLSALLPLLAAVLAPIVIGCILEVCRQVLLSTFDGERQPPVLWSLPWWRPLWVLPLWLVLVLAPGGLLAVVAFGLLVSSRGGIAAAEPGSMAVLAAVNGAVFFMHPLLGILWAVSAPAHMQTARGIFRAMRGLWAAYAALWLAILAAAAIYWGLATGMVWGAAYVVYEFGYRMSAWNFAGMLLLAAAAVWPLAMGALAMARALGVFAAHFADRLSLEAAAPRRPPRQMGLPIARSTRPPSVAAAARAQPLPPAAGEYALRPEDDGAAGPAAEMPVSRPVIFPGESGRHLVSGLHPQRQGAPPPADPRAAAPPVIPLDSEEAEQLRLARIGAVSARPSPPPLPPVEPPAPEEMARRGRLFRAEVWAALAWPPRHGILAALKEAALALAAAAVATAAARWLQHVCALVAVDRWWSDEYQMLFVLFLLLAGAALLLLAHVVGRVTGLAAAVVRRALGGQGGAPSGPEMTMRQALTVGLQHILLMLVPAAAAGWVVYSLGGGMRAALASAAVAAGMLMLLQPLWLLHVEGSIHPQRETLSELAAAVGRVRGAYVHACLATLAAAALYGAAAAPLAMLAWRALLRGSAAMYLAAAACTFGAACVLTLGAMAHGRIAAVFAARYTEPLGLWPQG